LESQLEERNAHCQTLEARLAATTEAMQALQVYKVLLSTIVKCESFFLQFLFYLYISESQSLILVRFSDFVY
jgi:hypothetical protein